MIEEARVLETNLDDVSGEVLAYVAERLFEEGAKDVCFIPVIAKKGRPAFILQAICDKDTVNKLVQVIRDETGTLGVREYACRRHVAKREIRKVGTKFGEIRVKVAVDEGGVASVKPEFEDLRRIAKKGKKPLKRIYDEVLRNLKT